MCGGRSATYTSDDVDQLLAAALCSLALSVKLSFLGSDIRYVVEVVEILDDVRIR